MTSEIIFLYTWLCNYYYYYYYYHYHYYDDIQPSTVVSDQ